MAAPALVALAHGSRDRRSAATVKALVNEVRAMRPDLKVEAAFLELSKPDFHTVVDRLVKAGHDEIVVVPLLLTEAYHAKVDVPSAVAEASARHPQRAHPGHLDPRPRGVVPRGARRAAARGARGRPGPRARRAGAGRGRLQRPARQPGRRPPGPGLGHAPQAAGHRGVRLERAAGHRRGRPRVPRPRAAATSRSPRCSWPPASCRTAPPSSPSRPVPSPSPSPSAPTPTWPAPSSPATPSAPSSSSPSEAPARLRSRCRSRLRAARRAPQSGPRRPRPVRRRRRRARPRLSSPFAVEIGNGRPAMPGTANSVSRRIDASADELFEEAFELAAGVGGDAAVDGAGLEDGASAGP